MSPHSTPGRLDAAVQAWLEKAAASRRFPIVVVLVAVALSVASWVPHYAAVGSYLDTPLGRAKAWWLDHPFENVPVDEFFPPDGFRGEPSHCDKLAFRAFLPLVNRITHGGVWTLVVACHIGGLVILWLTGLLVSRHARDPVSGALACWAVATCYAGQWGFHDFIYGDAAAVALLLAAAACRDPLMIVLTMLAACCTDERAAVCGPLVLLFHIRASHEPDTTSPARHDAASLLARAHRGWPIIAGLMAYACVRLIAAKTTGATLGLTMIATTDILKRHVAHDYPETVFKVFEFLWFIPAFTIIEWLGAGRPRRGQAYAVLAAMGVVGVAAILVVDIERSLFYLLPGVLLAACRCPVAVTRLRTMLLAVLVGNLLWVYPMKTVFVMMHALIIRGVFPTDGP